MSFTIEKLDHIVLNTLNEEECLDFYVRVLGCELIRKVESPLMYQLRAGDSLIDIKPVNERCEHANLDHFCLRIKPFEPEVLFPFLGREGVPYGRVENRNGATGFGNSVYIEDPDGNCIELKAA